MAVRLSNNKVSMKRCCRHTFPCVCILGPQVVFWCDVQVCNCVVHWTSLSFLDGEVLPLDTGLQPHPCMLGVYKSHHVSACYHGSMRMSSQPALLISWRLTLLRLCSYLWKPVSTTRAYQISGKTCLNCLGDMWMHVSSQCAVVSTACITVHKGKVVNWR